MVELTVNGDEYFMKQAIKEAKKAASMDEVPVGAVIVANNQIIARAHNQTMMLNDVTAHAEIIAITAASTHLGSRYLEGCTLYVTLEPCNMCAGALYWSQISRVVFGAADEQRGFLKIGKEMLHPKTKVEYGVLHEECGNLLTQFFAKRRR
jgi:tRNA(adenine34) deaminase